MKCEEFAEYIRKMAPNESSCKTRAEIVRELSDIYKVGMPNEKLTKCIQTLVSKGVLKVGMKPVKLCRCFYDPPPLDSDLKMALGLLVFVSIASIISLWCKHQ